MNWCHKNEAGLLLSYRLNVLQLGKIWPQTYLNIQTLQYKTLCGDTKMPEHDTRIQSCVSCLLYKAVPPSVPPIIAHTVLWDTPAVSARPQVHKHHVTAAGKQRCSVGSSSRKCCRVTPVTLATARHMTPVMSKRPREHYAGGLNAGFTATAGDVRSQTC